MTDDELGAIINRLAAVPWPDDLHGTATRGAFGIWSFGPFDPHSEADADFHAHARQDCLMLVAEVRRLRLLRQFPGDES